MGDDCGPAINYDRSNQVILSTSIPARKHRFSSDHRSQARQGQVSTWMGDRLGIPGDVGLSLFFFFFSFLIPQFFQLGGERTAKSAGYQKADTTTRLDETRLDATVSCAEYISRSIEWSLTSPLQSWGIVCIWFLDSPYTCALLSKKERKKERVGVRRIRKFLVRNQVLVIISNRGLARTQVPTTRNYTLELPTFGVIAGVNPIEVQGEGLTLRGLPS